MKTNLIQQLPNTELDIIGDIHGEIGALCSLLDRLGYNAKGEHREKRTLVFVGDLVDRGPNSIAVVDLVKNMFEHGTVRIVAGNHELNILRGKKKHGNHWFYGQQEKMFSPEDTSDSKLLSHESFSQCITSDAKRQEIVDFFSLLPIALEREDIRIAHACWHEESIERLRTGEQNIFKRYLQEENTLRQQISTPSKEDVKATQLYDLFMQNNNPIKVITSGLEKEALHPFLIGGENRYTERILWWKTYQGPPVIFGHYWRRRGNGPFDIRATPPPYLFESISEFDWLNQCFCVDYSVGARYVERATEKPVGAMGAYLCALRTHGNHFELLFDDGHTVSL